MEGYNKKVIMSYWTICRMKTTKKIYVKVSIIFLLGGILLFFFMREGGKSKDRSQPENIIHVFAMVLKFDELFL